MLPEISTKEVVGRVLGAWGARNSGGNTEKTSKPVARYRPGAAWNPFAVIMHVDTEAWVQWMKDRKRDGALWHGKWALQKDEKVWEMFREAKFEAKFGMPVMCENDLEVVVQEALRDCQAVLAGDNKGVQGQLQGCFRSTRGRENFTGTGQRSGICTDMCGAHGMRQQKGFHMPALSCLP